MNEELHEFLGHEVSTTRELLSCLSGAPTSDKFRRIVMLLLRGHYAHASNYGPEFEDLGCLTWSEDAQKSTLAVGFTEEFKGKEADSLPGVFVSFGEATLSRAAIGNYAGGDFSGATNFMAKPADLTLIVHHCTKEPAQAWRLADMSAVVLTAMAAPLALQAGASSFQVESYGPPQKKEDSPDRYYTVAMRLRISYNLRVSRTVESHRIRRIALLTDITH